MNKAAMELTGFIDGETVAVAQDEENPSDWYIFKSKEGFPLRLVADGTGLQFNNATLAGTIYESFGIGRDKKSVRFLLAGQPTKSGKDVLWGLLSPSL